MNQKPSLRRQRYFVFVKNEQGKFDTCGCNNIMVTTRYASVNTLLRYGVSKMWLDRGIKVENSRGDLLYISCR